MKVREVGKKASLSGDETQQETPAWLNKVPGILFLIAAALALILVISTILVFVFKKDSVGDSYRKADPTPQKVINMSKNKDNRVSAYTDIGELRLMTKAQDSAEGPYSTGNLLILSPWFSYPEGDKVFFEELAQKDRLIKSIISEYFASYTEGELRSMGEIAVKSQLKDIINQELVLGKIIDVYFEEYIFFE